MRANTIAYLRAGSFASLGNLKQLDLSQNKLTILSNNAFIGLESLELVNMSSNQFLHAPSGTLHPLTSLRKLDLSNNLMAQLAPGKFILVIIIRILILILFVRKTSLTLKCKFIIWKKLIRYILPFAHRGVVVKSE